MAEVGTCCLTHVSGWEQGGHDQLHCSITCFVGSTVRPVLYGKVPEGGAPRPLGRPDLMWSLCDAASWMRRHMVTSAVGYCPHLRAEYSRLRALELHPQQHQQVGTADCDGCCHSRCRSRQRRVAWRRTVCAHFLVDGKLRCDLCRCTTSTHTHKVTSPAWGTP
jgi:hypothetical protein